MNKIIIIMSALFLSTCTTFGSPEQTAGVLQDIADRVRKTYTEHDELFKKLDGFKGHCERLVKQCESGDPPSCQVARTCAETYWGVAKSLYEIERMLLSANDYLIMGDYDRAETFLNLAQNRLRELNKQVITSMRSA